MTEYVIGIDPDSQGHGVATYKDGELIKLDTYQLTDLRDYFTRLIYEECSIWVCIEDVKSNKFLYARNERKDRKVELRIAMKIGQNQQAQIELERMLDVLLVPYRLLPPNAGNWANMKLKPQFEKVTGWKGRSNKDTRSAAFFGYLMLGQKDLERM